MFSLLQLILTSFAGFLFAIHICIGVLSIKNDKEWKIANICILAATFLTGLYCLSESITYSGIIPEENFRVITTAFAGFIMPFYYLWSLFFFGKNELRSSSWMILFFGVPGIAFSFSTFLLDTDSLSNLRNLYFGKVSIIEQIQLATMLLGKSWINIFSMIFGMLHLVSVITVWFLNIKNAIQVKNNTESLEIKRNSQWFLYFMICGGGLILLSGILPLFLPSELSAVFGPIASLPMSLFALRLIKIKRLELEHLASHRRELSKYLPDDLVNRIIKFEANGELGGEESFGTVMFCDIRNFTGITERSRVQEVIVYLNEFFGLADKVVKQNKGNINKFIGDEFMAIFGIDLSPNVGAKRAVSAAFDLLKSLESLNMEKSKSYSDEILISIGIHSGKLLHGNVGSVGRMEYTVIGDTVNVAARITGIKATQRSTLIISEDTYNLLSDEGQQFKSLGSKSLKGKLKPVGLYEVIANPTTMNSDSRDHPMK